MIKRSNPIQVIKPQPFTGVDWSTSLARPGCQDAFKHPSRRGDGLHDYRPPYLNGSSASQPLKGEKR